MKEKVRDTTRREENEFLLLITVDMERARLRAAGLYGESDRFLRELLGDDVCDYWND
jgi:hypothetical protein